MNVIEALAKAAEQNHGRELQPRQVRELVTIMQAMQQEIAVQQARADGTTRIAAVALNQIGGRLRIVPDMYIEAEQYAVRVEWNDDEEGDIIDVTLIKETPAADVGVSAVQEGDDSDDGDPVSTVRLPESDSERSPAADTADADETEEG